MREARPENESSAGKHDDIKTRQSRRLFADTLCAFFASQRRRSSFADVRVFDAQAARQNPIRSAAIRLVIVFRPYD